MRIRARGCEGDLSAKVEELQLTRDDDPGKALVSFHRERRYLHVLRMSQHPYLEVHPAALESLDYIIGASFMMTSIRWGAAHRSFIAVSFLLIERLRREFGLT